MKEERERDVVEATRQAERGRVVEADADAKYRVPVQSSTGNLLVRANPAHAMLCLLHP